MEEEEIWKDIPGYEGYYQVSSAGRVRGLTRIVKCGKKHLTVKERVLKPFIDTWGYYQLCLSKNGKSKHFQIQQLMAISFLNHTADDRRMVVNHIDGDRLNNMIENIEVVTARANSTSCYRKNKPTLSSKYDGVTRSKGQRLWRSRITIEGKLTHLGYFKIEEDARDAYLLKLKSII